MHDIHTELISHICLRIIKLCHCSHLRCFNLSQLLICVLWFSPISPLHPLWKSARTMQQCEVELLDELEDDEDEEL